MRRPRKPIEGLLERAPFEIVLRLGVIRIASRIDLIAAGAEQRRGEQLCDGAQQAHGKIDRRGRSEAQLPRGRLVRIYRPWRRLGACYVLWVGFGDRR